MKKKLIIFMGPARAGKTEWINYLLNKYPKAKLVSDYTCTLQNDFLCYQKIKNKILNNNIVIVDMYLTTEKERKIFFDNLNIPKDIEIIGVWIENTWQNIVENNNKKQGYAHLEQATLKNIFNKRFPPKKEEEDFNDIYFLTLNANLGISLSCPILTSVQNAIDRI